MSGRIPTVLGEILLFLPHVVYRYCNRQFSLAVKPVRCTVDISKLLKTTMLSNCRKFSVFTGGTRSLALRCEAGPTLTAWNI